MFFKNSVLGLVLMFTTYSFAQESNILDKSIKPSLLEKVLPSSLTHFSILNGPSTSGNSNPISFDGSEDTDGVSSWHQLSFGWKISDATNFIINPRFVLEESPNTDGVAVAKLDDPVFGIASIWYKGDKLSFSGSVNTIAFATTEASQADGLEWNPGGFQTLNYQYSDQLAFGSWFWGRYAYYRNNDEEPRAPIFVSPFITLSQSDKLTYQFFYQVNGRLEDVDRVIWDPDDHLNFSFIYKINSYFTVQPIVTLFRETNFSTSQGNINFWVFGNFF